LLQGGTEDADAHSTESSAPGQVQQPDPGAQTAQASSQQTAAAAAPGTVLPPPNTAGVTPAAAAAPGVAETLPETQLQAVIADHTGASGALLGIVPELGPYKTFNCSGVSAFCTG
jgi:hypothetical protein